MLSLEGGDGRWFEVVEVKKSRLEMSRLRMRRLKLRRLRMRRLEIKANSGSRFSRSFSTAAH